MQKKISAINEEFDFKLLLTIFRKNALFLLLIIFLSLLVAHVIIRYSPPIYQAVAVLQVSEQNTAKNILSGNNQLDIMNGNNKLASSIELIRSRIIVERALSRMPVNVGYYVQGEFLSNELYKNSPFWIEFKVLDSAIIEKPIQISFKNEKFFDILIGEQKNLKTSDLEVNKWIRLKHLEFKVSLTSNHNNSYLNENKYFFKINDLKLITESIVKELEVTSLNADAKTIQIKLKDRNGLKATDFVNNLCYEYNKYDLEKNTEAANRTLEFIEQTLQSVNIELSKSENALENFKKDNNSLSVSLENSQELSKVDRLQNELFELDRELSIYALIKDETIRDLELTNFLLTLTGKSSNPIILNHLAKLQELSEQIEQLKLQATENSELFKAYMLKVKSQKSILSQTIRNEEFRIQTLRNNIIKKLGEYNIKLGSLPEKQTEYGRLQRIFNINEKFYSLLLEKKAEFSIARAGYVVQNIVLQDAKYTNSAISPKKLMIYTSSLLIGYIICLLVVLAKYLFYNEINALEEVRHYTAAALLGIIPKYKREIPISQLLVDKNPKSVISEAFRSVRTNLQFISNDAGAKTIAVTSTISGEGKTFNAINLAGVIAFSGLKVVILDLDMRKPKIHLGFNVENNHGMSTLLIGKDSPEKCILKSSLSNLDFITAGPIPPNPAELIISPKMEELLVHLKGIYDIIIVDLPPVGIVSDGIPIMQQCDYPLYILRANYSRKMFIAQINKLITENKVKNLSVILNGVEMSRLKYGYGYGYSYGYGYGYGYSYGYGYYEDDAEPLPLPLRILNVFRRK